MVKTGGSTEIRGAGKYKLQLANELAYLLGLNHWTKRYKLIVTKLANADLKFLINHVEELKQKSKEV